MTIIQHQTRAGSYADSVVLMQLQRSLSELPGIIDAAVVMATPANRELLQATGFPLNEIEAKADDMLIMVKAKDEQSAADAIEQVDEKMRRRRSNLAQQYRPRSLRSAAENLPQAEWVLVSVAGRYAASVAEEALDLDKHVFLYSDNVGLEDEIRLKNKAREEGLLLMGPDCGTAIINGIGLGFANRVRRGNIGLVAASGTGLQAVTVAIHHMGGGISQAIGTGGRDLSGAVGGVTALQGIELLGNDPETKVIVLVSKPPDPSVATRLITAATATGKPVVVNFLGQATPTTHVGDIYFANSLEEAAVLAVDVLMGINDLPNLQYTSASHSSTGFIRGLFSGGTLAYETLLSLDSFLNPLSSNIPLRPQQKLKDSLQSKGHTILDLGEDEFTQGRLHPMMDNALRLRRMAQEAADPDVCLILLDVVLGEGAHPNPAAELSPAIAELKAKREIEFVVIVLGTDEDPQDLESQIEMLTQAGAHVYRNTAAAVTHIARHPRLTAGAESPTRSPKPLSEDFAAINVGLESFHESLTGQGASSIQVDWRPPAGGDEKLMSILARMKGS